MRVEKSPEETTYNLYLCTKQVLPQIRAVKNMQKRVKIALQYYGFWLIYFLFARATFLVYHSDNANALTLKEIAGTFVYGLRLDASMAGYLSLIPFLLLAVSGLTRKFGWLRKSLMLYTNLLLLLITILITVDLELYRIWGFRLDATPLNYLNTPDEMLASVGSSPIGTLTLLNILINVFFSYFYRKWLNPGLHSLKVQRYRSAPALVFAAAALIIPIRGGLQQIPLNQSAVYFSKNLFANQAAINVPWNFFYSVNKGQHNKENPYRYFNPSEADQLFAHFKPTPSKTAAPSLLNTSRPNIVLIIWESFTAKAVESLGGRPEVTPGFDSLAQDGLLFTDVYASGDRSDKGLVAILSGYPTQPTATIIKTPNKAARLPQLSNSLQDNGYYTGFYYGGELEFANLRSYLSFGGYDTLVDINDFEEKDMNSKWGAHDHVVFNRMLTDMQQMPEPFFSTIFTLSSHEPFEVPMAKRFEGEGEEVSFLNSLAYTDSSLVAFLKQAENEAWFSNSLFIVLADHGHAFPGLSPVNAAEKFYIPMLWWGPALNRKAIGRFSKTTAQTDLAATLLQQLGLSSENYRWSRNVFDSAYAPAAPYFFRDGVGIVTDSSRLSWDNVGRQPISTEGDTAALPYARAYLQKSFGDYLEK